MKTTYEQIWEAALPFQDKRDDAGHAAVTYGFAQKLVSLAGGEPQVIFPAIILHDTGWSRLTREERFVIFSPTATRDDELAVRYRHQEEGVAIARKILGDLAYPEEWTSEILEIISQHDTRDHFISHNEGIVRDADKLWRFSDVGFGADVERFEYEPDFLHDKLVGQIPSPMFFYSPTSRELALEELAARKREYAAGMPVGTIEASSAGVMSK